MSDLQSPVFGDQPTYNGEPDAAEATADEPKSTALDTKVDRLEPDFFRMAVAAISLVLAWQNRRERGQVLPLAEQYGLIEPLPYSFRDERHEAEARAKRIEQENALNAMLTGVPPAVPR